MAHFFLLRRRTALPHVVTVCLLGAWVLNDVLELSKDLGGSLFEREEEFLYTVSAKPAHQIGWALPDGIY